MGLTRTSFGSTNKYVNMLTLLITLFTKHPAPLSALPPEPFTLIPASYTLSYEIFRKLGTLLDLHRTLKDR